MNSSSSSSMSGLRAKAIFLCILLYYASSIWPCCSWYMPTMVLISLRMSGSWARTARACSCRSSYICMSPSRWQGLLESRSRVLLNTSKAGGIGYSGAGVFLGGIEAEIRIIAPGQGLQEMGWKKAMEIEHCIFRIESLQREEGCLAVLNFSTIPYYYKLMLQSITNQNAYYIIEKFVNSAETQNIPPLFFYLHLPFPFPLVTLSLLQPSSTLKRALIFCWTMLQYNQPQPNPPTALSFTPDDVTIPPCGTNITRIRSPNFKYFIVTKRSFISQTKAAIMSSSMLCKIGMCSLNNDSLDFLKNRDYIIESIRRCKQLKCAIRVGSELEVPGYSCLDHFNEYDTITHSWQIIRDIIESGVTEGIVCDIGTPVIHHGTIYNCRVILLNGRVLGIRAKTILADGDNYYETRWFGFWKEKREVDEFKLPKIIQDTTGQTVVPIGVFLIDFNDACLGYEICQQAWISDNPMIEATMDGVEIMVNPSASNVERGKLARKLQMLKQLTQRHGGCYLYTNVKGCTGQRLYFDGGCISTENGVVRGLSNLNTLQQISVTPVIVNITDIRTFRLSNKSFLKSSNGVSKLPRVKIDISVCTCQQKYTYTAEQDHQIKQLIREYQFPHARFEPSLFLWDYLKKSKSSGFFLPLSGGLDSCAVALIVYNMCCIVYTEIVREKNERVLQDLREIIKERDYLPRSPEEICGRIFFTCYMKTDYSSKRTQDTAKNIAKEIGSHHRQIEFNEVFQSIKGLCNESIGKQLLFQSEGGNKRTDLSLQNLQGRLRMVLSYLFAQTELQIPERSGYLLVLGATNLDDQLVGNYTKYDTSSADVNPIGSFSKQRIKQFLRWSDDMHKFQFIKHVVQQRPETELMPVENLKAGVELSEQIILTYQQIERFGVLRRVQKLGPVSMFQLICRQSYYQAPRVVAEKIKTFFRSYSRNRHKLSVMTPSFHYYPEGIDDNRLDLRPLFYETAWTYQFEQIDRKVGEIEEVRAKQSMEAAKEHSLTAQIKSLRAKYVKRASIVMQTHNL